MINTLREVIALADSMAAAASQMGAMGYDTLITSREMLVEQLTELYKQLESLNSRN